jgi:large-conductance mechanosensitive channel
MLKGFRDFLMRGNVLDLAVAVVIGVAFGAVVIAFSTDFIGGIIGAIGVSLRAQEADAETPAPSDEAKLLTEIRDLLAAQQRG